MRVKIHNNEFEIPNSKTLVEELPLPEFFYDICWEERIMFVAANKKYSHIAKRLKEVSHIYISLFDIIRTGRYNLSMACIEKYCDICKVDHEEDDWVRLQYISNSLMWYNASFDIVLQAIYLYYGLFNCNKKFNYKFGTENIDRILKYCRWDEIRNNKDIINQDLYGMLLELKEKRDILNDWTIKFKHRGNILKCNDGENFYFKVTRSGNVVNVEENGVIYDSSQTQKYIPIDDVIVSLVDYHIKLIDFIKDMSVIFRLIKRDQ